MNEPKLKLSPKERLYTHRPRLRKFSLLRNPHFSQSRQIMTSKHCGLARKYALLTNRLTTSAVMTREGEVDRVGGNHGHPNAGMKRQEIMQTINHRSSTPTSQRTIMATSASSPLCDHGYNTERQDGTDDYREAMNSVMRKVITMTKAGTGRTDSRLHGRSSGTDLPSNRARFADSFSKLLE